MHRHRVLRVVLLFACCPLWSGSVIRLKTRDLPPAAGPPRIRSPRTPRHLILQFAARPEPAVLQELAYRRMHVLAFLPDTGLMVSPDGTPDWSGLGVVWAGPLEAADKISPALLRQPAELFLVMFHPDVDPEVARGMVEDRGLQVLGNSGLLPGHLLVAGDRERTLNLAARDEVAYIMPARSELAFRRTLHGCPGPLTPAGPLAEYALNGTGWPADAQGVVSLQYFFQNLSQQVDSNMAQGEIGRALAEWTRYARVAFSPAPRPAAARSLDILFAAGPHGDSWPFSDTNILAHAFYPAPPNTEPVAGDLHFNAAVDWRAGSAIDLFSVALHEAGHALGLAHSDNPEAVMYPYYKRATGLAADDIAALQALYGSPSPVGPGTPQVPPVTPPVTPPSVPPPPPAPPPNGSDTVAPALSITAPAGTIVSATTASIDIAGTASDNVEVVSVQWSASTGASGAASGTRLWSAAVPLLVGTNVIIVRAYDAAGNSGWRTVTVVRR